jgi:hypothetical protein
MDMHRSGRTGDPDGQYIRLRYSMQLIRGGQPHIIEVEVAVPVGASAEERDQLIREAEANLEQMYRQIERRSAGRVQQPPEASRPQATPAQAASHPTPSTTPPRTPAQPMQPAQAVAQANARDTSQSGTPPGRREMAEASAPGRPSIGSEMPVTPNLSSAATGNMRLGEFIQIIRSNWGLTPKDAKEMLQVPNLNNMNYRELLRQLEPLVAQRDRAAAKNTTGATGATSTPAPATPAARPPATPSPAAPASTVRDASVKPAPSSPPPRPAPPANATNRASPPAPAAPKPTTPAAPQAAGLDGPANIPVYPLSANTLREAPRSYKFDEEEEDDETEEAQNGTGEDENGMSEALARIKIDELRENPGTATVSPARLTVLHNLLDSQISDEQFQQLIEGLWNINTDKKLKQNQVESLISWAKEDYFEDEVRAVIAVLKG